MNKQLRKTKLVKQGENDKDACGFVTKFALKSLQKEFNSLPS